MDEGESIMTGYRRNSDFVIDLDIQAKALAVTAEEQPTALAAVTDPPADDLGSWNDYHRRLGHPGMSLVKQTSKVTTGVNVDKADAKQQRLPSQICEDCVMGKQTRQNSRTPGRTYKKAKKPGERWHVDLSGGGNVTLAKPSNYRYLLAFT